MSLSSFFSDALVSPSLASFSFSACSLSLEFRLTGKRTVAKDRPFATGGKKIRVKENSSTSPT
jgi:hypothetical protein